MENYIPKPFHYHIPIIWLDTNVIIDIALAKESCLSNKRGQKILAIYNNIIALVQNKKVICAERDQRYEYGLNPKRIDPCDKILSEITLGLSFLHFLKVRENQITKMMKVYLGKEEKFFLHEKDIFSCKPEEEIERTLKNKFIISIRPNIDQKERERKMKRKMKMKDELEKIRKESVKKGEKYEQRLKLEYLEMPTSIQNYLKRKIDPKNYKEIINRDIILTPLKWWKYISNGKTIDRFFDFLDSDLFKNIPFIDIEAKLISDILTEKREVKKSDALDIEHLKTVLPYCDMIITDKDVSHRIKKRGLDERYKTKVFSLRDCQEIIAFLNKINKK